MLQIRACALLLMITADTLLVRPSNACDGHVNLSQDPTGHFGFSPQGMEATNRASSGLMTCTRTLELPAGRTVQLKLVWLESGSNVSLLCFGDRDERSMALGDTALLYGCDGNRATLTWSGAGHSSNAFQLFYYVQEVKRSYTENLPIPDSQPNTSTPDSATSSSEESPFSDVFPDPSKNLTHSANLTQSTPLPPPLASATTDREASLFPGEESDNEADASGALSRTDIPGRLDFFSSQHTTSARSDFSQNTQSPTVTASNEVGSSTGTYASTEINANSQTLGYDKKSLVMSSAGPLLEMSSAVSEQNASLTKHATILDSVKNLEISGAQVADIPSSSPGSTLQSSSSLFALEEESLNFGSTEMPNVLAKLAATAAEAEEVYDRTMSIGRKDSSHTMSLPLERSGYSIKSTQETIGSEYILKRQLPSQGTPFPSLEPHVTRIDLGYFHTSTSANDASTTSTLRGSDKGESKISPRVKMDLLSTGSYLRDQHTTNNELLISSTQPMSTLSSGESETNQSNGIAAEDLSTVLPDTISPPQIFKTTNGKLLSKTELFSPVTASTPSQVSDTPYQTHGKYVSLATSTATGLKREKETTATIFPTSFTTDTVSHLYTSSQPSLPTVQIVSSTVQQKPKYYIVPDEPVIIKEKLFELLLTIRIKESTSASTATLDDDVALWLQPHLQKIPGFKQLLSVWPSDHTVQCVVQFDTRAALPWLPRSGGSSLLERTGLKQLHRGPWSFRAATITNITLGDVPEACGGLLQCPPGFTCALHPRSSNYSCRSLCHSDYCQHHALCTHHPAQLPVCRCVAGQDSWFMGQRCEVRMTRARLVLSCLGVLSVVVGVVGVLACMAVRRYRALLIQAKVDQTRSSYRRFNHFDELSGRFWQRWCSADSLDNPAFSRSDEILQLRALERPCCYHDDSLSLPSTCPSPGLHLRTIYPHSSQYAWRGSEQSVGDGVLDSGKASDLSVCSWPREPIQWSPFPLLQQLALQRPPAVRVTRTRSCCDGLELVDMNKSWTA